MVGYSRLLILCLFMVGMQQVVWAENNSDTSKQNQESTKEEYKEGLQDIGGGFKKMGMVTGKFFDRALDKVRLGIKNSFQSGESTSNTKSLKKDKAIEEDLSETETPVDKTKQAENNNTGKAANNSDLIVTE